MHHTPLTLAALTLAPLALAAAAPHANAQFTYALDDGSGNVNVGPPSSFDQFDNTDMIWGNYFTVTNNQNTITSISLGVGSLETEPRTVSLIVWNDPDNDNDPTDITNTPAASFEVSVSDTLPGEFLSFNLPTPATVDGGFFVAAALRNAGPGTDRPGNLDPDSPGSDSWLIYSPDLAQNNLAASIGFATPMDNPAFVPIQGAWTIRATAIPTPAAAALALPAAIAAAGRRRRR